MPWSIVVSENCFQCCVHFDPPCASFLSNQAQAWNSPKNLLKRFRSLKISPGPCRFSSPPQKSLSAFKVSKLSSKRNPFKVCDWKGEEFLFLGSVCRNWWTIKAQDWITVRSSYNYTVTPGLPQTEEHTQLWSILHFVYFSVTDFYFAKLSTFTDYD